MDTLSVAVWVSFIGVDMREIKFRAWDNRSIKGKMTKVSSLQFNDWLNVNGEDVANGVHCHLMQYTGLKDKNGVEIYEGDIISDNAGIKAEVRYIQSNASFMLLIDKVNDPQTLYAGQMFKCEVIGNIYSNPELLEKSKS